MELVFCDAAQRETCIFPSLSGKVVVLLTSLLYTWQDELIRNNQHQKANLLLWA